MYHAKISYSHNVSTDDKRELKINKIGKTAVIIMFIPSLTKISHLVSIY